MHFNTIATAGAFSLIKLTRRPRMRGAVVAVAACCAMGTGYAQDEPETSIDDGRSDYRYVATGAASVAGGRQRTRTINETSTDAESGACAPFDAKYVHKHDKDKGLLIQPGQTASVFLKNAYFANVKGFFSSTAEAAILLNTDVNAARAKKSAADYGKLIWYSESVSEESSINASFVPAAAITTTADTGTVVMDLSVVQFDSKNSALARGILRTILAATRTAVGPEAGLVLDALGSSIVTSPEGGTRTLQYTLGFLVGYGRDYGLWQPILREGELVIITSPRRRDGLRWQNLRYGHRSGLLYTDIDCKVPAADFDYLVLSIRRNVNTGLNAARAQTLGDAIDAAKRSNLSAEVIREQVMGTVNNVLASDIAKQAIEEYNQTGDPQLKRVHLKSVMTTLACSAIRPNTVECEGQQLTDPRLSRMLATQAVRAGVMCESDLVSIRTSVSAAAASAAQIPTVVDKLAKAVMTRLDTDGQLRCD